MVSVQALQQAPVVVGPPHALVVDADPAYRVRIATALIRSGFRVAQTPSGLEALRLAYRRLPSGLQLLVTDVDAAVLPGPTLAGRLQELYPDLPILLTSARGAAVPLFRLTLLKPFSSGTLIQTLTRLEGLWRPRTEPRLPH